MIKYEIVNEYLHIFYRDEYDYYPISLIELGDKINWKLECRDEKIVLNNVSERTMHLMRDKNLSIEFAKEFQKIIQKYSPKNEIDWKNTDIAINIYNEYRKLTAGLKNKSQPYPTVKGFDAEARIDIIKKLKIKFNLN